MMYMDDAVKGTIELMDIPKENLPIYKHYNLSALSFSAKELENEIKKHIPLEVTYIPDNRQAIADSTRHSIRAFFGICNVFSVISSETRAHALRDHHLVHQ